VALAVGVTAAGLRPHFRLVWHFGLFQFMMPLIGRLGGEALVSVLGATNRFVAPLLLFSVAAHMLYAAGAEEQRTGDPTRGWSLVALSVATSLDALGVGFGLAWLEVSLLLPCFVIGVTASLMTFVGMRLGRRAGGVLGPWAERAGAGVLIALGVKFLF